MKSLPRQNSHKPPTYCLLYTSRLIKTNKIHVSKIYYKLKYILCKRTCLLYTSSIYLAWTIFTTKHFNEQFITNSSYRRRYSVLQTDERMQCFVDRKQSRCNIEIFIAHKTNVRSIYMHRIRNRDRSYSSNVNTQFYCSFQSFTDLNFILFSSCIRILPLAVFVVVVALAGYSSGKISISSSQRRRAR